jgi:hypothetical protein
LEIAMKKLSRTGFEQARNFILSAGRLLEKARFNLEFEGGPVDAVLTQLAQFQNPDGGFGQALEPDMRTPTSSALATEIGVRILAELDTPTDHPLVKSALKYLLDSYDPAVQVWRIIPSDANDHPHAPWWHNEADSLARTFDDYRIIPRTGLLALLYNYADRVPADWLAVVTTTTMTTIQTMTDAQFDGGGDTLTYTQRLAAAPGLPAEYKEYLAPRIQAIAAQNVERDPTKWTEYCAPPLKFAPSPDTIAAAALADCLPTHLDYLIETQTPEGYWDVNWSWGDFYPEVWTQARQEWRADLTLMNLLSLRAYDRLEA